MMNYLKEFIDFQNFDIQEEPLYDFKVNDRIFIEDITKPAIYWDSNSMIWINHHFYKFDRFMIIDIKYSSEITSDFNNRIFKMPENIQEYLILLEGKWPWFKLYNFKK